MEQIKYPIGQQSFEELRKSGSLYVDKTPALERLILSGGRYFFLGRPRRFGKSLFLSMLGCFFEGKRELFSGLYADSMDWNWDSYPVLYLDLNVGDYSLAASLNDRLNEALREWSEVFGVSPYGESLSVRFGSLIHQIRVKTGKGVVILVDEYDKPLVNNINRSELAEIFRESLASFYANFKSCADDIKMVFLTGVSRFGHLSVFSGLNNINDISFDNEYSDICGITECELTDNFKTGIKELSLRKRKTLEETLSELKKRYDGYRFSEDGVEIYNPYSLLNVMQKKAYRDYWIQSGTPTLLVEMLKRYNVDLASVITTKCSLNDLSTLNPDIGLPAALLYQTGYLTIKDYDDNYELFTLGIPNMEVKNGFFNFLLPYYANLNGESSSFYVMKFVEDLKNGNAEEFMCRIKSFFASISYEMRIDEERNLQNALLVLIKLIGLDVNAELRTSDGRIDLFIRTDKYYYIIELKYNGSAESALNQIKAKNYSLPFAFEDRKVIAIGANFSASTRTIADWKIIY